ncbi:MAG: ABC transporter ATP-binding protein [Anaerolineaceae bacterium]|nr:ABC transporter ATP-binding protein [Anaerolineaceae bacterium]
MANDTMIDIQSVSRSFRQTLAVDSITLSIRRGELFGIVGPDGAGKSTLLRMMAAILNPTGGTIAIAGHDSVKDAEDIKSIMGYMPQGFGLYTDLSVQENLRFTADVYGVTGAQLEKRLPVLYEFTDLASFKDYQAGKLSGGMKKKLALACAIIHEPPLLLLDEPTTGVDPVARRGFWDLLSGLHAQGTTTVVSTPYMDEAERCNRVALLYNGRVLACDSPSAIKARVPGAVLALTSSDNRRLAPLLLGLSGVIDIQTYGNLLNIIVTDRDTVRSRILDLLDSEQIDDYTLEDAPMRMEEAFIYLVNHAEGALPEEVAS